SAQFANFFADNGGLVGTNTLIDVSSSLNVSVGPGAMLIPSSSLSSMTLNSLTVSSNGTFLFKTLALTVTSNLTIAAGGKLAGDGQGFLGTGSGLGASSTTGSGGGGHAGAGGYGAGGDQTGREGTTYDLAGSP